jgi:hypothetical protein
MRFLGFSARISGMQPPVPAWIVLKLKGVWIFVL